MSLKFQIEKLEDVAENLRSLYTPHEGKFFLDVDGAVSREKLDEFRTNNITLKQQLDALKDLDPTEYKRLKALETSLKKGQTVDAAEVDRIVGERVKELTQEYEGKLTEAQTNLQSTNSRLESVMVDSVVKDVAAKTGALPQALDDVLMRAKIVFKVKDGALIAQNANGQPLYDKDGTSPLSVDSWVKNLKASAPHLFIQPKGSGAPGGGGPGGMNPANMSSTDKISAGLAQRNG